MALGRVTVAQLHHMRDREKADEVHQHLEAMTCGRLKRGKMATDLYWSKLIILYVAV